MAVRFNVPGASGVTPLALAFLSAFAVQSSRISAQSAPPATERPGSEIRAPQVYSGRDGNTTVRIPRFDALITVDGTLDEPQWADAAQLTGFSQFNPSDGRPSLDSTVALVWYGPDAVYFAVRAYAPAGTAGCHGAGRHDSVQAEALHRARVAVALCFFPDLCVVRGGIDSLGKTNTRKRLASRSMKLTIHSTTVGISVNLVAC